MWQWGMYYKKCLPQFTLWLDCNGCRPHNVFHSPRSDYKDSPFPYSTHSYILEKLYTQTSLYPILNVTDNMKRNSGEDEHRRRIKSSRFSTPTDVNAYLEAIRIDQQRNTGTPSGTYNRNQNVHPHVRTTPWLNTLNNIRNTTSPSTRGPTNPFAGLIADPHRSPRASNIPDTVYKPPPTLITQGTPSIWVFISFPKHSRFTLTHHHRSPSGSNCSREQFAQTNQKKSKEQHTCGQEQTLSPKQFDTHFTHKLESRRHQFLQPTWWERQHD